MSLFKIVIVLVYLSSMFLPFTYTEKGIKLP